MWARPAETLALVLFASASMANATAQEAVPRDPQSGLVMDTDWQLVLANCGACHSTRLVTQNRMSAAGWLHAIRWMQEKHNLWELGDQEAKIIAYLERNYGLPESRPRRQALDQPPLEDN